MIVNGFEIDGFVNVAANHLECRANGFEGKRFEGLFGHHVMLLCSSLRR